MGEKITVGPINKGIRTDRTAFVIDNDSFPVLINAYQWRGRVKRKRGTRLLGRLRRFIGTTDVTGALTVTILPVPIEIGVVSFTIGSDIFVDPGGASPVTLLTNGTGMGTLDRTTGILTITGSIALTAVIYYPTLPVMGLEDLTLLVNQYPGTLAFDPVYSYNISTKDPYPIYDVSFYKNPVTGTYPGYVAKSTWTPTTWNGEDYQQFWTVNYQGALWTTNGIDVPFTGTTIGMQFKNIVTVTVTSVGPPAIVNLQITGHGLVVGDFIFINEVVTTTGINFQTGYVTAVVNTNNVTVEFPNATITGNGTLGIAQYLTNRANPNVDSIRWYDGDPTNGVSPLPSTANGWVNFAPPLSEFTYSIADLPPAQYYLVGARMIVPFKDRLLFFGPVVQASTGNTKYLQDTVIYSQNGTPYYTLSYTNSPTATVDNPTSPTNVYNPILVPVNQTATPSAYFEDQTGFGGFLTAGIDQPIVTSGPNEDVLLIGFDRLQTRLIYSGNDINPFAFFNINSELGSGSTFSGIIMDKGILSRGNRGYIITSQVEAARIDLEIPGQVFEINLNNNGAERVTAQRDFINEWIQFSYPSNEWIQSSNPDDELTYRFPNQTLQFNYRDNSWAIFNESYTHYGQFRPSTGFTWASIGAEYESWNAWTDPWVSGESTLFQTQVIAGNQQGFVMFKDDGISEGNSLYIQNIVGSLVTSPNHCLNEGDYIVISGVTGTVGAQVNGNIFSVVTPDLNTFLLNPSIVGGTYTGGGFIQRMYVPFIQTKQFPTAWGMGRKTRIGTQRYLLTTTANAQIQLLMYLSQDDQNPFNTSLVPDANYINNVIYSTVLYTCPESTNLGLTPANINLNIATAIQQQQTWHRVNTSLIGDTVQLGFTLSDTQMRALDNAGGFISQFAEIELHGMIIDVSPSQALV